MGVVQMGVVQTGVVQMGVVQMGVVQVQMGVVQIQNSDFQQDWCKESPYYTIIRHIKACYSGPKHAILSF